MAYTPTSTTSEQRYPSGIVFFGASSSKPMLDSSSAFIIDEAQNSLAIANDYYIGSQGYKQLLQLSSDGVATFASGVVIEGNLTVNGQQIVINTENIVVEDNIITLSSGDFTTPSVDAGIEVFRGTGNMVSVLWDESSDKWTFTNDGTNYDTLVGATGEITLTNKTIDGSSNTLTNIGNASLVNDSVTINAGSGLANGGTVNLGDPIRLDIDIAGQTELSTAPDAALDYLLIYDASVSALRKINRNNFVSGLGTMTSFTLAGDTGTNQSITNGNTVTIAGGTGLSSVGSNTDTVTINLDNTSVSAGTYGDANTIASFTVDAQGRLTGASGIDVNITASQVSDFTAASETAIFTSANFVDGTALNFTVTSGASVSGAVKYDDSTIGVTSDQLYVKDGGITFAKLAGAAVQLSSESFVDNDTSLMTSAAIQDKILSYGYSTTTGTVTSVATAGTVNGITLTGGTITSTGTITLGGTLGNITVSQLAVAAVQTGTEVGATGGSIGDNDTSLLTAAAIINYVEGKGYSTTTGTVTSVATGTGLTGGTITSTGTISIANGGVDTTQLAAGAVTEAKRERTIQNVTTSDASITGDIVIVNSSTARTVTLPNAASGNTGYVVRVKNVGTGAVTISSASNIDGAGSKVLYYQYESMTFVSNGSTWYVI